MFTQTCPVCGVTAKIAAFRTRDGKVHAKCRECFHKHKRKMKRRAEARKAKEIENKAILRVMQTEVDEAPLRAIIRQLRQEASTHKQRLRRYTQKMESGEMSARTASALQRQKNWVNYFDDLEAAAIEDFKRGRLKPYLHYRSNTFLLHMHHLRYTA